MKKRRNHIVPRFYLERWAPKGYVGLWVKEEKKIKLIPPKKVLREKGKHETVDDLLQVVESHIAPIISKIVENEEIPRNYQERENILVWILIQIQRTHLWEKKTQSLYRGILDMIRSDSVIRRYIREDGIGIDEVISFYKRKFPSDIFNFNRMRTELYIKYMRIVAWFLAGQRFRWLLAMIQYLICQTKGRICWKHGIQSRLTWR